MRRRIVDETVLPALHDRTPVYKPQVCRSLVEIDKPLGVEARVWLHVAAHCHRLGLGTGRPALRLVHGEDRVDHVVIVVARTRPRPEHVVLRDRVIGGRRLRVERARKYRGTGLDAPRRKHDGVAPHEVVFALRGASEKKVLVALRHRPPAATGEDCRLSVASPVAVACLERVNLIEKDLSTLDERKSRAALERNEVHLFTEP